MYMLDIQDFRWGCFKSYATGKGEVSLILSVLSLFVYLLCFVKDTGDQRLWPRSKKWIDFKNSVETCIPIIVSSGPELE
jgi:hypothetical protein